MNFNPKKLNELEIRIQEQRFSLYIDKQLIGSGVLKAKSWQEMRLFVSSGSDITLTEFNIKRIK